MPHRKVNQEAYAILFKHLLDGPMSAYELAEESGLRVLTSQELMRCLLRHKVVHICGWIKNGRGIDTTPIYKLGEGRNKPRHVMSAAERKQRARDKKKAIAMANIFRRTEQ